MKRPLVALAAFATGLGLLARFARVRSHFDLTGATVLITGGGRGLGLQLAREAARRGAKLGLVARSAPELEAARAELAAMGARVAVATGDVRDPRSIAAALAALETELGATDVLINVAGIIGVGPLGAVSLDDFRDAIDTNFLGALYATEYVRPGMQERKRGRIVNIASLGGKISIPHMLPYCASKFAILGYSAGLRTELAKDGIGVVTIVPGLMRTGSPPRATFVGQPEREYVTFALSDALPFVSIDVGVAARTILDACERNDAECVVGWQAKVAIAAATISPGGVAALLGTANRLLPGPGNVERRPGFESESWITRTFLTVLSRRATVEQNEMLDPRP